MKLFILYTTLFFACCAFAIYDGHTDWCASRGISVTAVSTGTNSFWGNPAGLCELKITSVALSAEREWGLGALSTGQVACAVPFDFGTISVGGMFTGNADLYNESFAGVAFGSKIWRLNLSVKSSFVYAKCDDWSASAPVFGFGVETPIGRAVKIGAWGDNITASKIDGNEIPVRGAIGASMAPTDWIVFLGDVYFDGDNTASLRVGQELSLMKTVFLRTGLMFNPNSFHLGLGTRYKNFELCWSYIGHPELGGSTLIGLSYEGIEKK